MKQYDLIILGWGKAGKTLAMKMGKLGQKVALVEKNPKMYGGTCVNVGCLPTKSLVHSAKIKEQMEKYGLTLDSTQKEHFFEVAMKKKAEMVQKLNQKNFGLLHENENVDLFLGKASFVSEKEIRVQQEVGEVFLRAEKILINTGAVSRKLGVPGEDSPHVLDSEGILELEALPKKLLIVGAGFIGLEFASYFSNFGTEVSIFQFDNQFLAREDEEDAKELLELLKRKGIAFSFQTSVKSFEDCEERVKVFYEKEGREEEEVFDKVLVAIGRAANTKDLALENTKIEVNSRAEIVVDSLLRTTAPNVWAAGDVKGGAQFTYISLDDSRIILPQLLGREAERSVENRSVVPTVSFIDPPFARVGINEKEAKEKKIDYVKKYLPTIAIPKAHVIGETEGFSKILINGEEEIIGATLFHYEAAEMINLLALAIQMKIKYTVLRDFIYSHPVMTESLNDILA